MRVLVVAPWAPNKTRPRATGLIDRLSRENDVTLVAAAWSQGDIEDLARIPRVKVIGVRLSKTAAIVRAALSLFRREPLQQGYLNSPKLKRAIVDELSDGRTDLLYLNVVRTAQFAALVTREKTVIDLDEFRSEYYRVMSRAGSSFVRRLIARLEYKRLIAEESRILEHVDRIIVSSPAEAARHTGKRVYLVRTPHLMQNHVIDEPMEVRSHSLVFVGRLSYQANHEAISWFIKNVMPALVRRFPDTILQVVGDSPKRELQSLGSPHVLITGWVPSVEPFYSSAAVSVVPVVAATGAQMKLIESMFLTVPTVTTEVVARGAGVTPNKQCLVATTPAEWIDAISRLFDGPDYSREIGRAAKEWVDEAYGTTAIDEQFAKALDRL